MGSGQTWHYHLHRHHHTSSPFRPPPYAIAAEATACMRLSSLPHAWGWSPSHEANVPVPHEPAAARPPLDTAHPAPKCHRPPLDTAREHTSPARGLRHRAPLRPNPQVLSPARRLAALLRRSSRCSSIMHLLGKCEFEWWCEFIETWGLD
jgi:hypothetical protein